MGKEIVLPGELLGIEEEILSNEQTFTDKGNVFSSVIGEKTTENRLEQVKTKKFARMLKQGDVVVGRVQDLYDSVSLIVIESESNVGVRKAIGSTYAFMRITELVRGSGYVKSFRQHIKIGDILRAKVIEVTPLGTYLSITEKEMGVLKAHCSECHKQLSQRGRLLICDYCGNKENRKLAMH